MEVYRVGETELEQIPESELSSEQNLEEHLIKAKGAEIGGVELLYVSRQGSTAEGGIFDILAVDEQGDTVIVELKRGQAPRNIVAQALEYASSIRDRAYAELDQDFRSFLRDYEGDDGSTDNLPSLKEEHAMFFDRDDDPLSDREFNAEQRLLLVGTEFRDETLNMADFLREHDIDVICVTYQAFESETNDIQLLTTENVRRPLEEEPPDTADDGGLTDYRRRQLQFWEEFVAKLDRRDTPLNPNEPAPEYYLINRLGIGGVELAFEIRLRDNDVRCNLVIRDQPALFQQLWSEREEIEEEIGGELIWRSPDDTKGSGERSRIEIHREADLDDESTWDDHQQWLFDYGERFYETFRPRARRFL